MPCAPEANSMTALDESSFMPVSGEPMSSPNTHR
jgi:hypothetical protein